MGIIIAKVMLWGIPHVKDITIGSLCEPSLSFWMTLVRVLLARHRDSGFLRFGEELRPRLVFGWEVWWCSSGGCNCQCCVQYTCGNGSSCFCQPLVSKGHVEGNGFPFPKFRINTLNQYVCPWVHLEGYKWGIDQAGSLSSSNRLRLTRDCWEVLVAKFLLSLSDMSMRIYRRMDFFVLDVGLCLGEEVVQGHRLLQLNVVSKALSLKETFIH